MSRKKQRPVKRCIYTGKIVNGSEVILEKYALDYVRSQGYDVKPSVKVSAKIFFATFLALLYLSFPVFAFDFHDSFLIGENLYENVSGASGYWNVTGTYFISRTEDATSSFAANLLVFEGNGYDEDDTAYAVSGKLYQKDNVGLGVRWGNVTVPENAIINSAFYRPYLSHGGTSLWGFGIQGIDVDNASYFVNVTNMPKDVVTTTANVVFSSYEQYGTPQDDEDINITSIVQEIVARDGWVSGNGLGLKISGGFGNPFSFAQIFNYDNEIPELVGRYAGDLDINYSTVEWVSNGDGYDPFPFSIGHEIKFDEDLQ